MICNLSQKSSKQEIEDYTLYVRALIAAVIGTVLGLCGVRNIAFSAFLVLVLAYPIHNIEVQTDFIGMDFFKQGLFQGVTMYYFCWFGLYNVIHTK